MSPTAPAGPTAYHFGVFELNLASRQLLRNGRELHLQDQPLRLLILLLTRQGELCTREELRKRLWPTETFVEFDDGLNTAVQKIRQVLGDDARNPRFVETVPRQGYRFIAPIQIVPSIPAATADLESAPAALPAQPVPAAIAMEKPVVQTERSSGWWIGAVALVGLAAGWMLPHGGTGVPPRALTLSITPPTGVELRPGILGGSAVSPDGRMVAFVGSHQGKTQLWVRSLDATDSRALPGTEEAILPFWSPDSKYLGFISYGKVRRVDLSGGRPLELAVATRPTRGAWMENGAVLYAAGAGGPIFRAQPSGGAPVAATPTEAGGAMWPHPLYGTDNFVYFGIVNRDLQLYSLSATRPRVSLASASSNAVYAPPYQGHPGYLLWLKGTTLVAQAFDVSSGKLSGEVIPVTEGVGFADRWNLADLSVSRNGILVYGAGNTTQSRLAWVRRDGSVAAYVTDPEWIRSVRLSPDGRRALIERGIPRSLWILDFDRNLQTRVTFDQEFSGWPVWAPGARQIAYSGERGGSVRLLWRETKGGAGEERLVTSPHDQYLYDWSKDGEYLLYCEVNPETKLDLWVLPTTGKREPIPLLKTKFNEDSPRFSPDGRWIAYVSDESGRNEVYVTQFPGPRGKWQISTSGGALPKWSSDGRELFYLAGSGSLIAVPVVQARDGQFEWSPPRALFKAPMLNRPYDVSTQGDRFLMMIPTENYRGNELTVQVNWQAGLRR